MTAKSTWALIAATVVAVASVTAAGFVLADRSPNSTKKITGTSAETPGLAWSLDPAEYLGRPFADFSDPRGGSSFNSGEPGFIVSGDTLVTIAGIPTAGMDLKDPVMIGVNATDGTVLWQAPAHDLVQCSETPLGGRIYCYALNTREGWSLVTYDIESGASVRRKSPEAIFGLTTTSDTLYIAEGSPEENDVRVHSGTFDDVSANWTHAFDIGGSYEELYGDVLTVTNGVGLVRTGNELAQFDTESGTQVWSSSDDCVYDATLIAGGVVAQSNTDCETYNGVTEQLLRDADGTVLVTTDGNAVQNPIVETSGGADVPVLLGDSAFDPETGQQLWTNPDLVESAQGAVSAIAGGVVYVRDPSNDGESGIDVRTGKQLWHNDTAQMFTPTAGHGTVIVGTDGIALTALDVRTGKVAWTAPFVAIDPDPETFGSGGAVEPYDDGWIFSSDRRMIRLSPL